MVATEAMRAVARVMCDPVEGYVLARIGRWVRFIRAMRHWIEEFAPRSEEGEKKPPVGG